MSWIQLTQNWAKILRAKTSQKVEGVVIYSMTRQKNLYARYIECSFHIQSTIVLINLVKYKSVESECQQ
jgi:hypothetical protein